ncbi:Oxysterol-binding protein-domain-containing protein [Dipodascopsis tothii]|uniref:Oxysterol-binding protein-domain-containing protein n=1 Tax=Dipodascopsis tothii TaxID=44089 RepID=UPI0034CDFC7B
MLRRSSTVASTKQKVSLEDSIRTYKLLEALRSNDTAYLTQVLAAPTEETEAGARTSRTLPNAADVAALLHLAVQGGSAETVEFILKANHPLVSVNSQDADGNTPLHLAAAQGRADVVSVLMQQPEINDTVANNAGKQAVELCRGADLAQAMQISRAQFVEAAAMDLKKYFVEKDFKGLDELLALPRVSALLDINGQDPDTGSTVLHDAVRAKDVKMVQFILDHGGDPFRRNRKGKLPVDLCKDDNIKKMLKASSKRQSVMTGSKSVHEAPRMKGYLKKWTNYTSGYKLRWFVLEKGILSYYKHQDDANTACRGSINMRIATLRLDSSEKQKFEIIGKGSVRYHLRANHPVEANRWIWCLTNAIQLAKDEAKAAAQQQQHLHDTISLAPSIVAPSGASSVAGASGVSDSEPSRDSTSDDAHRFVAHASPALVPGSVDGSVASIDEVEDYDDDDESQEHHVGEEPSRDQFMRTAHSMRMEIDALHNISVALTPEERIALAAQFPRLDAMVSCFDTSLKALGNLLEELMRQVHERETYFQYKAEREADLRRLWEDNMQKLAEENDQIEGHLQGAVAEKKMAKRVLRQMLASEEGQFSGPGTPPLVTPPEMGSGEPGSVASGSNVSVASAGQYGRLSMLTSGRLSMVLSEDEDDEFFDAIDENASRTDLTDDIDVAAARTAAEQRVAVSRLNDQQATKMREMLIEKSFAGYEDPPRTRLAMEEDDRPKISLWGILKSMIGKDMTKMTLPVSFNECTSLLQRVAEDMEYTDLLDIGATKTDSTLRMVYVAAFAASEYSSTINRIAKPFNPLLGETYEYCRPDKGYRFVIEQVSHHPPVGAAMAESPLWDYTGESAVRSKFNGRSFDINPLGTWFLTMRPCEAPEELYTWKKVTSSVVGIITGSPVVDNYGDMVIKNHQTGDVCKLKFKQRGWLGAGAYELFGTVYDHQGKPRWSVGGRWNDKIYARAYVEGEDLASISGAGQSASAHANAPTAATAGQTAAAANVPFLVWQNHDRPPTPFNLTQFAITLNAKPERLVPWLPPTDTRLRPDQRAMEDGEYDTAAKEKNRLEEKQRAKKRWRDNEGISYSPRWFAKTRHPVTGEEYWRSNGQYWRSRVQAGTTAVANPAVAANKTTLWQGVDNIF